MVTFIYIQETGLWLRTFSIPEKASFSGVVQQAIESGLISSRARRELVQILRTLITRHTVKPIGKEYNGVCQKLVSKFPKLQDPLGTDGFVSKICSSVSAITGKVAPLSVKHKYYCDSSSHTP